MLNDYCEFWCDGIYVELGFASFNNWNHVVAGKTHLPIESTDPYLLVVSGK